MKHTITEFDPSRITQCIEQKGLSKNKIFKETGIKRASLAQYEEGKCCPTVKTLVKFANYVGAPIGYFFVEKQVCVPDN